MEEKEHMETNLIQPTLTVIIPMYNCAPVILRCLDSIDFADCEIIVVNDGSTDNGANVVKQYMANHPNVRLITKSNGGVSSARNLGIENAQGKYISFIDADDYIVKGGLERIVQIAEKYTADVVKFRCISVSEGMEQDVSSVASMPIQIMATTGEGVLNRYDISDYIVWDGIYRREVIVNNNVRFMEDLSLHEDDVFMGMLYCHAMRVVATDLRLYRYVRASNYSSTHRQSIEKQRKLIISGLKAVRYRGQYMQQYNPHIMELERLKYMRWVCPIKSAIEAEMSYSEYKSVLDEFRKEKVYPLNYSWIRVAGMDSSLKLYTKRVIQTLLVNHPMLGWPLVKWYYRMANQTHV